MCKKSRPDRDSTQHILERLSAAAELVDISFTQMYYFKAIRPCCVFSQHTKQTIHHHNIYCEYILYTTRCAGRLVIYWIYCLKTQQGLIATDQSL
jgi:hypothetical protein